MKKLKVYLAGKITFDWWREALLKGSMRNSDADCSASIAVIRNLELDTISDNCVMTGPYAIACDHKCYHSSKHAIMDGCGDSFMDEAQVINTCIYQIHKANFVFAYIEHNDCYGTIAEIGYAYANNIPVFICFANEDLANKMWFISEMAEATHIETKIFNYIDFFKKVVKRLDKEWEDK